MLSKLLLILIIVAGTFNDQLNTEIDVIYAKPAIVKGVKVTGDENAYSFAVTLKSPDTGCAQYANWWEVISLDGNTLYYRRILGHSHVDEQPFTRSGGSVKITAKTEVIIRAHMHPTGYGNGKIAMKGTVAAGFKNIEITEGFGEALELAQPLPNGCAF